MINLLKNKNIKITKPRIKILNQLKKPITIKELSIITLRKNIKESINYGK